jgi:hypothetical protein
MAYDSQRGKTVMFGGDHITSGGQHYYVADTWEWDGSVWTLATSIGPAPRAYHAMAYDSSRGRTVLFGGQRQYSNIMFSDTWEWDGTNWTQVASAGPVGRIGHAMVYDSQRGKAVMFGGTMPSVGFAGDTWEWDGSTWAQVASAGPPPRFDHAMAYDSQRGRTVLFSGFVMGGFLGDTWEWDGTNWTQVASAGPVGRYFHGMAYDSQRGNTVLFGGFMVNNVLGDTWEWNGGSSSTATTFGTGCGYPALDLSPAAPPTINTTAQALLTNSPSSLAFVALGWSRTAFGPFALPLTLATLGLPGCYLLQSSEFSGLPVTFTGTGTATFSVPVPNTTGLIGLHVFLQGWAYAPGANSGQLIVSNGIDWGIGI